MLCVELKVVVVVVGRFIFLYFFFVFRENVLRDERVKMFMNGIIKMLCVMKKKKNLIVSACVLC